jgi:hypothetical protein
VISESDHAQSLQRELRAQLEKIELMHGEARMMCAYVQSYSNRGKRVQLRKCEHKLGLLRNALRELVHYVHHTSVIATRARAGALFESDDGAEQVSCFHEIEYISAH